MEQFGDMLFQTGGDEDFARGEGLPPNDPLFLRIYQMHRRKFTNIHKPDTATLKQLGIAEGHEVVVQVLHRPEQLCQTHVVLRVARRNTAKRTAEDEREVTVDLQGNGASSLSRALAQVRVL